MIFGDLGVWEKQMDKNVDDDMESEVVHVGRCTEIVMQAYCIRVWGVYHVEAI